MKSLHQFMFERKLDLAVRVPLYMLWNLPDILGNS